MYEKTFLYVLFNGDAADISRILKLTNKWRKLGALSVSLQLSQIVWQFKIKD